MSKKCPRGKKTCLCCYLSFICLFFSRYLDVIEQALACGETVLIENLPEKVDPALEPVLGRNTTKRGRLVLQIKKNIKNKG